MIPLSYLTCADIFTSDVKRTIITLRQVAGLLSVKRVVQFI